MNGDELKRAWHEIDGVSFAQIFFEKAQNMSPNPFSDVYNATFADPKHPTILIFPEWKKVSANTRRAFQWFNKLADWVGYKFNKEQKGMAVFYIKNIGDKVIDAILSNGNPLLFIRKVQKKIREMVLSDCLNELYNLMKIKMQQEISNKFDKLTKKLPGGSVTKDQFVKLFNGKIGDMELFPALAERDHLKFIEMLPEKLQNKVKIETDTNIKLVWFDEHWEKISDVKRRAYKWFQKIAEWTGRKVSKEEDREIESLIIEMDVNALIDALISKDPVQLIEIVLKEKINQNASESECSIL